jgi:hypothetical protein
MKLSLEEHIQHSREAASANKAKGNRHAELFTRMYSDPFHFFDELIQNAEDAYARKAGDETDCPVRFVTGDQYLDVLHRGIDFDEEDLKAITTFAGTTKTGHDEVNQIGKFGIGFRSVFAVTDHPEIHCGDWHFRIDDYEVLERIPSIAIPDGFSTLIRLPYRESDPAGIRKMIRKGLSRIRPTCLLFLEKISCIEICSSGKIQQKFYCSKKELADGILWTSLYTGPSSSSKKTADYLQLSRKADVVPGNISIAFACKTDKTTTSFYPVDETDLFVYFATLQESHLPFLLHAPFTTTPTREAIPFDKSAAPENLRLLKALSLLLSSSLYKIKTLGMLNASLFALLPLEAFTASDSLLLKGIREELIPALKSKRLIPADTNHYGTAAEIAVTPEPGIQQILDKSSLQRLFQRTYWLHNDFNAYPGMLRPMRDILGVREIDIRSLGFRIAVNPAWIQEKPHKWFPHFYALLASHPELWDSLHHHEHYSLRTKEIIRLNSGETVAPYNERGEAQVFLPQGKGRGKHDIHPNILNDPLALNFLELLGIRHRQLNIEEVHNIRADVHTTANQSGCRFPEPGRMQQLIEGLLQFSGDNGMKMLYAIAEAYSSAFIAENFTDWLLQPPPAGSLKRRLRKGVHEMLVFAAIREEGQHRYQMSATDWSALNTCDTAAGMLLLTIKKKQEVSAEWMPDAAERIKKGRITCDPVSFSFT